MPFKLDPKTGNARHVSDDYVTADDLGGNELTVTIERVEGTKVKLRPFSLDGKERPAKEKQVDRILVYFRGGQKPLMLNSTNAESIINMFGKKAASWIGKQVVLYPDTCKVARVVVDCIRIRPASGRDGPPSPPPAPPVVPDVQPQDDLTPPSDFADGSSE
jgi:hypothetical protein